MKKEKRIGVYICNCGVNISKTVRVKDVAKFASTLPGVVVAREYLFTCSDPGQAMIRKDIREMGLNGVVVAACSPHMHEKTFRRVLRDSGLNPYLLQIANIREHCSWVHEEGATEKAEQIVAAAVSRARYHEPLDVTEAPINPNTLVVGAGIAGIQAALDIANAGHQVYLVEREPSIGGHMIQLDKTFPTLDCSACITTPRMSDTGSHPNIKLLNYSEVEEVSGYTGNFTAKIRRKATGINSNKCTGCRICFDSCPVVMKNEFDVGIADRKAVYIPFPQAVPNKAVIDRREARPCKAACMHTCPIETNVPGYVKLIAEGRFKEAYLLIRATNPLPSTCGRVCYAPCEAACNRSQIDEPLAIRDLKRFADEQVNMDDLGLPTIEKTGRKVAVVGAGPAGLAAAHDLALSGHDVTLFEALPEAGGMLRYGIPRYRLPKEALDREVGYIRRLGVDIKTNTSVGRDIIATDLKKEYDALFIAPGASGEMKLNITGEEMEGVLEGIAFLRETALGKAPAVGDKVAIIGGGNTAIDCARTARRTGASEVTILYRRSRAEMPASVEEILAAEHEGIKIEFLTNPLRFLGEGNRLAKTECIRMELGEPDGSGRPRPVPVAGSEFTLEVDTAITALGQTAQTEFVRDLGLSLAKNGAIEVSMDSGATSVEGVFSGGDVVTGPAYVIDAIAAGKKAARSINRYLKGESIEVKVERKAPEQLSDEEVVDLKGCYPAAQRSVMPEVLPEERIKSFAEVALGLGVGEAVAEAGRCLAGQIEGCIECGECERRCAAQAVDYTMEDEIVDVNVGSIILATGYDPFDPTPMKQFGYKRYDNVLTALEFERLNSSTGPTGGQIVMKNGKVPESVAILHCIGSRDKNYHEYCSRVCCMFGLKFAHLIKDKTGADVYQMYIDMRCFGEGYEEFYERVGTHDGVKFIRGKASKVTDRALTDEEKGKLTVCVEDTLLSEVLRVPVDMVILLTGLEPRSDAEEVARMFSLSRRSDGFFMERHVKLDPVATMTEGVFVAGCCESPKDIPDTVSQAKAAAAEVLSRLARGVTEIEPTVAHVDEDICSGCGMCVKICAYGAPSVIEPQHRSRVNEALCKGCGACAGTCPSGAISQRHFTFREILSEIEELAS